MTLFDDEHHYQQYMQQQRQYKTSLSPQQRTYMEQQVRTPDHCSSVKTPCYSQSDRFCSMWTTPPVVPESKRPESLLQSLQTYLVTPSDTKSAETLKIDNNYLGRKRQRVHESHNLALPTLLPGFPELDDTADSNPFKQHFAIHSPIAGIENTLNLEFIANIKSSKTSEKQRTAMPPSGLPNEKGHGIPSSFSTSSRSSVSSEEIERIKNSFPILDDPLDSVETLFGDGIRGENYVCVGTRALRMRRRCRKDNPPDIFNPMSFT